jgi:GT2 family glycosyltransferase
MATSLWVLIAAAGKPELLARTLTSLAAAEKPRSYRGTIVVENGPPYGVEAVVRKFPAEHRFAHRYVPEANKSHALNCALRDVEGLVFMTDDDVRLDPRVLCAYDAAAAGSDSGCFYGGPVEIDAEHGLPPPWLRRYYPLTIVEPWSLPHEQPAVVYRATFMGTNWAAFASDLRAIGGFDTRLGPGGTTGAAGQETEAERRLLAQGCEPVYVPGAVAWHYLHREFLDRPWILKRAYRHALEWGLRRTRDRQPALLPILRGACGIANARAKAALLRILGGEQRRFAADFHEARWRGRWDGLWLGRRWNELPQIPPASPTDIASRAA